MNLPFLSTLGSFLYHLCEPGTDQRQPLSSVASSRAIHIPERAVWSLEFVKRPYPRQFVLEKYVRRLNPDEVSLQIQRLPVWIYTYCPRGHIYRDYTVVYRDFALTRPRYFIKVGLTESFEEYWLDRNPKLLIISLCGRLWRYLEMVLVPYGVHDPLCSMFYMVLKMS